MPKSVPIAEIEAHLAHWAGAAEAGESILVTRQGRPVFALVPATKVGEQEEEASQPKPGAGLAGLAGGWEGSEDLVKLVGGNRRSRRRRSARIG